jgi:2-haloacid dehalogenase
MPYQLMDELHRSALAELLPDFSLESLGASERDRLVMAWHHLPAWPDAVSGLNRLRERHIVCTLSNGGMAHQVDVVNSAKLPFDCILSTELVQSYKPDPRTYQLVPSLLRISPGQAMMVASHPYDLAAAAAEGFRTAFVRRPMEWGTGKSETPDFRVDITADDFNDLAAKLPV